MGWLSSCQGHERCRNFQPRSSPSRLVELPDTGDTVRICSELPTPTPYVILSHAWGPDPQRITKLTKACWQEYATRIEESHLTKNFQDAVAIARKLGQRYIWINALCILQDDEED